MNSIALMSEHLSRINTTDSHHIMESNSSIPSTSLSSEEKQLGIDRKKGRTFLSSSKVAVDVALLADIRPGLLDLAPELLLMIFAKLNPSFVLAVLPLVCRDFHGLLCDQTSWRLLFKTRRPFPGIPTQFLVSDNACDVSVRGKCSAREALSWQEASIVAESLYSHWLVPDARIESCLLGAFENTVDCVALADHGKLVISGGRNREVVIWNLGSISSDDMDTDGDICPDILCGHTGWVWDIVAASNGKHCYTASWDGSVRFWDIEAGTSSLSDHTRGSSAMLSLDLHEPTHTLASGSWDRVVRLYDVRGGVYNGVVSTLSGFHKKPVLGLSLCEDILVSCSEDKTIVIFDRRAGKVRHRLKAACTVRTVRMERGLLLAGTGNGTVLSYDATVDGDFRALQEWTTPSGDAVTGVWSRPGLAFTSHKTRGGLQAYAIDGRGEPCAVNLAGERQPWDSGPISQFDIDKNVLVAACPGGRQSSESYPGVAVWRISNNQDS